MAKTKEEKQVMLDNLKQKLGDMNSAVFVNFLGLKVKDVEQFRKNCRAQDIDYVVAKKTLLKKALQDNDHSDAATDDIEGEVAAVIGHGDEVAPAKTVNDFAKTHQEMKVLFGILEGQKIDADKVIALANLPSRPELLARAVGSIAAPLSGFVNVLQGNIRNLVYVVNAIKEKKS